jgi:excisionase family DNA binding protein
MPKFELEGFTMLIQEDRLRRLSQAADELNISSWTLRVWLKQGKAHYHKLGRLIMIPQSEINRLVRESRVA